MNVQPDLWASPWIDSNWYTFQDYVVYKDTEEEADVIYECSSINYCSQSPNSEIGKLGWKKTAYSTAKIIGYRELAPEPIHHWYDMSRIWDENFPWFKNDIVNTEEGYFKCLDSLQCRIEGPGTEIS